MTDVECLKMRNDLLKSNVKVLSGFKRKENKTVAGSVP